MKKQIIFWYNTLWNSVHFWYLKIQANRLHKLTGKQYWIVPKTETSCMVVDNSFIKEYNRLAPKSKRIDFVNLEKMAYYCTGRGTLKAR